VTGGKRLTREEIRAWWDREWDRRALEACATGSWVEHVEAK
jgi:hypothetical protein